MPQFKDKAKLFQIPDPDSIDPLDLKIKEWAEKEAIRTEQDTSIKSVVVVTIGRKEFVLVTLTYYYR